MMEHTLESLLNDKDLRLEFIFYVNKIHAQESLLFWMEVEMFKRIVDSDECFKQAKLLYFRYIHPSAKSQINVSAKLKAELETTMATGIWDPTLYNAIQVSVHECLKFSVVRDFCQYMSKRKVVADPDPDSPTCVMLERYEGALQRSSEKEKDKDKDKDKDKESGSIRKRTPNLGSWLKKKSTIGDTYKPKEKKSSFLGKSRTGKIKVPLEVHDTDSAGTFTDLDSPDTDPSDDTEPHRERLTQQRLQQQIQLLRTLHQHQHENFKQSDHQYNTLEFASTTNATPLAKSVSMPTIIRGLSMANMKNKS